MWLSRWTQQSSASSSSSPLVPTPGYSSRKWPGPVQVGKTPGSLGGLSGHWPTHDQLTFHTLDSHSTVSVPSQSCCHVPTVPPASPGVCFPIFLFLDLSINSSWAFVLLALGSTAQDGLWFWCRIAYKLAESTASRLEVHLPSLCQPQLEPREVCHMGPPALEPCSVPYCSWENGIALA